MAFLESQELASKAEELELKLREPKSQFGELCIQIRRGHPKMCFIAGSPGTIPGTARRRQIHLRRYKISRKDWGFSVDMGLRRLPGPFVS